MIHLNAIHKLVRIEEHTKPLEFDIECVSMSSGRVMKGRVVCTSSNFERNTINIMFLKSGQTRTIRTILLTKFNGTPVLI